MRIYFSPNLVDSVQLQAVAISKMKPKEKKRTPSEAGKYNSVKKKNRIQSNLFKRAFLHSLATENLIMPPNDGEHFSANWKGLQEVRLQTASKRPRSGKWRQKSPNLQSACPTVCLSYSKCKHDVIVLCYCRVDIWFDDVDPDDIEATVGAEAAEIMRKRQGVCKNATANMLVKEKSFEGLTRVVAIDCEMVGVGPHGEDSILARVSLVNHFGKCIYDKYVKPSEHVTDYRTAVSGIRPTDIAEGEDVATVRKEVADILHGRIVVGHAIHNDFKVLLLDHPKKKIRDTQKYKPFMKTTKVPCHVKRDLVVIVGQKVQDAQAAMRLYTLVKKQWEADFKKSAAERRKKRKPKAPENGKTRPGAGLSS
uniref:RNA exonuclease 4 n=1 Tax=Hippocampus comes TaxID=109280 RepID=A0A3Q3E7P8_HIPCM